jgi:hypothetical protein
MLLLLLMLQCSPALDPNHRLKLHFASRKWLRGVGDQGRKPSTACNVVGLQRVSHIQR